MTQQVTLAEPLPQAAVHCPHLPSIIKRVAANLWLACVMPAVIFTTFMLVLNVWAALVAALVWSYSAIGWQLATGRRKSGLLLLAAAVITVKTAIALASGNTFLYFVQPVATDLLLATVFFGSLMTARPVVSRMAGDFYPMDAELASRPRIRRLFWYLTLMWAGLLVTKATMTLYLLESQSVQTFVVVKNASVLSLNGLAVAATISAAVFVARKEGLLPQAERAPLS